MRQMIKMKFALSNFCLFSWRNFLHLRICCFFIIKLPSSLSLLTNILSTEIPVTGQLSGVCVRGQRLAFTPGPRRFQLTAAVALTMWGFGDWLPASQDLACRVHVSLSLEPAQGHSPKVSEAATHTQPHIHTSASILLHFPPLTAFSVKSGIGIAVKSTFT